MITVISPAKTLDYDTAPVTKKYTDPEFLLRSQELIKELKKLTPAEVASLMKVSDKISCLNVARYTEWKKPFTPDNAKQAILAFKGDVYTGLNAETMSTKEFSYAQKHLRILSGLYGLLRPLDLIQPYRLEMGTKFANAKGKSLYEFWGDEITEQLNKELKKQKTDLLVNLASNEYFKSVNVKTLSGTIITPVFKDEKNGQYKIISFFAKKARGMMARYIIDKQITDVAGLRKFKDAGYKYDSKQSTPTSIVFMRPEQ